MHQVTIHEAKTHLSKLIQEVLEGEEVIIAKGKLPIAKLIPYNHQKKPLFGNARGLVEMAPDFDEPLPDFADYME